MGCFVIDSLIALNKRRRYQYKNKVSSLTDYFLSNWLFFSVVTETKAVLLNQCGFQEDLLLGNFLFASFCGKYYDSLICHIEQKMKRKRHYSFLLRQQIFSVLFSKDGDCSRGLRNKEVPDRGELCVSSICWNKFSLSLDSKTGLTGLNSCFTVGSCAACGISNLNPNTIL